MQRQPQHARMPAFGQAAGASRPIRRSASSSAVAAAGAVTDAASACNLPTGLEACCFS